MEENDVMLAAEPAAALLSEEVRRSGILSQVMKLSQPDKGKRRNLSRLMSLAESN